MNFEYRTSDLEQEMLPILTTSPIAALHITPRGVLRARSSVIILDVYRRRRHPRLGERTYYDQMNTKIQSIQITPLTTKPNQIKRNDHSFIALDQ